MRTLELYLNNGIDQRDYLDLLEKDVQRTTKRTIERKGLDISRFQQVWDSRKQLRQKFSELPDDAR